MPIETLKNYNFQKNGFKCLPLSSHQDINKIEIDFYNRILLQAYKLRIIKNANFIEFPNKINLNLLIKLVIAINKKNKRSLDFVSSELRESPSIYNFVNENFVDNFSKVLNCPKSLLKIHFDGILINLPSNKSRLYKFHSEKHYYPFRKNFVNFWMPMFFDKNIKNGTMVVKDKSHVKNYSFNEYSGFDKKEKFDPNQKHFFHQFEVPRNEVKEFKNFYMKIKKNIGVIFHSNLVHASTINQTKKPSFALVARVYDYRKDMTLSDVTGIKPYSKNSADSGFPDLRAFTKK